MSGGSFDYLCYRDLGDGEDLFCRDVNDIERMAAYLEKAGFSDAAERTLEALAGPELASVIQKEMCSVWKAVEWIESCDYGPEDLGPAVFEWRKSNVLEFAGPCSPEPLDVLSNWFRNVKSRSAGSRPLWACVVDAFAIGRMSAIKLCEDRADLLACSRKEMARIRSMAWNEWRGA